MPKLLPAHWLTTRTQAEDFSSNSPMRSQWNCTRTRPYSSVWISLPLGPTMVTVCRPYILGSLLLKLGPGRQGIFLRRQVRRLLYSAGAPCGFVVVADAVGGVGDEEFVVA